MTDAQEWVDGICTVLGWDYHLKSCAGRAARLGKELRAAGGTLEELREHFGQCDCGAAWWWFRDTWQGRKGQYPTQNQLTECWGAWRRPIAVHGDMGALLAYAERLRHGDNSASH